MILEANPRRNRPGQRLTFHKTQQEKRNDIPSQSPPEQARAEFNDFIRRAKKQLSEYYPTM